MERVMDGTNYGSNLDDSNVFERSHEQILSAHHHATQEGFHPQDANTSISKLPQIAAQMEPLKGSAGPKPAPFAINSMFAPEGRDCREAANGSDQRAAAALAKFAGEGGKDTHAVGA